MFRLLGVTITRLWPLLIAGWVLALVGTAWVAPSWDKIAQDSDVSFLPGDAPSRRGDRIFQEAFPEQYAGSGIVLVLTRDDATLQDQDERFIEQTLTPRLEKLTKDKPEIGKIVKRIRTLAERGAGALLVSPDNHSTLVIVDLAVPFLEPRANPTVHAVEGVVASLRAEGSVPKGMTIAITGSATAGRDLSLAQTQSVHAIETWTIVAVVVLLSLLYRAPLVALIPLATVFAAVEIALNLLALMGQAGIMNLSRDVRIFVTVLAYGAGVDYCLFLIARYREELQGGMDRREAMIHAVSRVGDSITASAATVICGIGVLAFMEFGKVREAGLVIPFALFIVLCGTLTFSAALLMLAGKWAFWPHHQAPRGAGEALAPSFWRRLLAFDVWEKIGPVLVRRPGLITLATIALMVPFAAVALNHYQDESYNPLADLARDAPSVAGTRALERHFPPGFEGILTVFVRNDQVDFSEIKGDDLIGRLTGQLGDHKGELGIADVRSVAKPLGVTSAGAGAQVSSKLAKAVVRSRAAKYYVSRVKGWAKHLTRLDIVLAHDPLAADAIRAVNRIEAAVPGFLPEGLRASEINYAGGSVSIRDLAVVKQRDLEHVEIYVPIVIFVLLWIVLRRVAISLYLVLSVMLSYLATLGVAYLVFWALYPATFTGLDWKVPIFLFTILVAVGEDYNIFLMTRVKEEQLVHGPVEGIIVALARTGRVISSCGFIMAGTFASLLSGSLLAIKELGFALSFGILLDTLVVRPVLVPAFLILLESRLGRVGRYMALSKIPLPSADGVLGHVPAQEPRTR